LGLPQNNIISNNVRTRDEREKGKIMKPVLNYDFLNCARKMPELRHKSIGKFDICKSEVAAWLMQQPEIMQKVFDMASRKGVIVYDRVKGTWKGADR
jgi:hypothetical protein